MTSHLTRCAALIGAAAAILAASGTSLAVDIKLSSTWMRPAAAGSTAKAYVDIASDTKLTLVGASSPLAKKVAIVVVEKYDGVDPGKVVKSLPIASDKPTRLAYLGSHLRLVDVKEDLSTGMPVPVELDFRDAAGKHYRATANVVVHGLLFGPEPGPVKAEPKPEKALITVPKAPRPESPEPAEGAPRM